MNSRRYCQDPYCLELRHATSVDWQHHAAVHLLPCRASQHLFDLRLVQQRQPADLIALCRYVLISVGTMAAYWYSVFSIIYGRAAHGPDYKVR